MSAAFPTSAQHDAARAAEPLAPTATQRLEASRERLRNHMMRTDGRQDARRRTAAARASGDEPTALDRLRSMPVIGVLIDAVSAWWLNHPLHAAASVAEGVAHETIAPMARRHPIALVAAAFAAGVAIAWFKPWRRIAASALVTGFTSQVLSHALTQMPWESLLGAFTTFAQFRTPQPNASTPESTAAAEADTAS